MEFTYRNIKELITGLALKDAKLYEALNRINNSLTDINNFLNKPSFDKLTVGNLFFASDRNQLNQGSAMTQGCRIYYSADYSIPDSLETVLLFDMTRFDTDGMFNPSLFNERIKIKTPGIYMVGGCVSFQAAGKNVYIALKVNGGNLIVKHSMEPTGAHTMNVNTIYQFAQGDYIQLVMYQGSGGFLDTIRIANYSVEMWAHRLS